jgi:putative membrane protein
MPAALPTPGWQFFCFGRTLFVFRGACLRRLVLGSGFGVLLRSCIAVLIGSCCSKRAGLRERPLPCYTAADMPDEQGGTMGRLVLRLLVTAASLFAAVALVNGVDLVGVTPGKLPSPQTLLNLLIVAVIFGLINAIVRPILKRLTCAITFFTLGLFIFVINALMLLLTSLIARQFEIGFTVDGFLPALFGSVVITVMSVILSVVVPDKDD